MCKTLKLYHLADRSSIQHLVAYPILQGKIVNVAAYVSDLSHEGTEYTGPTFEDVTRDEFTSEFDLWEEEVRGLVNVRRGIISTYLPIHILTYFYDHHLECFEPLSVGNTLR